MGQLTLTTALTSMLDTAPVDWWRYIPCGLCRAQRGQPCLMGGWSWPTPARQPHAQRKRDGLLLHGTIWLLDNGYADDVLRPTQPERTADE